MNGQQAPSDLMDRRKFLQLTGGLAAVGVAATAAAGGVYASNHGSSGTSHDMAMQEATPTAAATPASERPKASGKLAAVRDASLAPADPNPSKTLLIETKELTHEVAAGVT